MFSVGLMSALSAARWPRGIRPIEDLVNLFLLPSMTPLDMAYGTQLESGMSVISDI